MVKKQFFEKRKLIFTSVILMLAVFLAIMYQSGFINLQKGEEKYFANTELNEIQNLKVNSAKITKTLANIEKANEDLTIDYDYVFDYLVTVNWDDSENANGLRPEFIDVTLVQDGVEVQTERVTADTNWQCTFSSLRAYVEGTETAISYSINTTSTNGYNVYFVEAEESMTVNYKIEGITERTKNIYVQKDWSDEEDSRGKRPETVTVNLYRDGEFVESAEVSEATEWKHVFEEVPKYKNSTESYEYTIAEVQDEHYDPTYNQNYETEIEIAKEAPADGETVRGLRVTFNSQTATEEGKDTINIYYKLGDTSYRLGSYSGTALAGQSVDIPSTDFWIYMYSDYIISGGYGYSIDSIEHVDVVVPAAADREERNLPTVTATETSGDVYPESPHSPYGDDLKALWYYDGESREDKLITNTYRVIDSDVVVHYYLEGTTQKVRDDLVIEGYAWEEYTVPEPEGIESYYEYVSNTDNLTGEFAEETTEVIYYYKYKTYDYKVEYYYEGVKDESKTETLSAQYADEISTYTDKVISGYKLDKTSTLPLVMTDNVDTNVISVYYTKRDDLAYVVKYIDSESKEEIATEKVVEGQTFESVVTEEAIEIDGYVKPTESQSITIDIDNNEITFEYDKRTDLTYTVRYIEEDTKVALAEAKVVENKTFKEIVTEEAIEIDGYVKPTESQSVEITTGDNVITFYYTKRQDLSVTIYIIDKDTNTDITTPKVVENLEYLLEYTMELEPIDGYNIEGESSQTITIGTGTNEIKFYVTKRTDLTYTIKYVDKETGEEIAPAKVVENQTYLSSVREDSIDVDGYVNPNAWYTFQIGTGTNEYKFEYDKRTDLSYTVRYLEEGTEKVLSTSKVVENKTFKEIVTEEAISITGYVLKSDYELSTTIGVTDNEITFYYTKRTDLSYTVRYMDNSTGEIIDSKTVANQTFESVITEEAPDIDGYNKLDPTTQDLTIIVGLNQLTFYYAKRTDLVYEVQYVDKETREEIAETKVVENKTFKDVVTETPIEIDGYVKPTNAQTITIGATDNTITFEYEKRTDLTVTVSYIDKETGEEITLPVEWENNTFKDVKTYEALTFDGYIAQEPTSQTIEITTGSNNIVFYYVKRKDLVYTVKYVDKDSGEEISTAKVVENQTFKDIITEDAIEIDGYVKPETTSEMIEITTGENIIEFAYTKRTDLAYSVKYIDSDTKEEIADTKEELNKTFGENITETAIEIDGYVKPSEVEQTIEITTSVNEITFEYTKRNDLSYTVYYKDQTTGEDLQEPLIGENRTFKEIIECSYVEFDGYNLVSPETQTVEITTGENTVTFYYAKKNDLYYTVKYLEADTERVLAQDKVVTGQIFKAEVTEEAIDIEGFVKPSEAEQTIEIATDENTIIFYYTKRADLVYTVKYLEADTDKVLEAEKTVENQTFEAMVSETAIDIEGYDKVDPTTKEIQIAVDGNEIIFYYTKRTDLSYAVKYLEDGTNTELAESKVVENQTFEAMISETAIDIDGYNKVDPTTKEIQITVSENTIEFYYTKRTDLGYTVYYKDKETDADLQEPIIGENRTFKEVIECNSVEFDGYNLVSPETQTIEITTGENTVTFYYTKRTDLVYEVEYLEANTNEILAEEKVVENQTFKDEITETAIEIDGYAKPAEETQTVEITTGENKITFYYTKRTDLVYEVKYVDKDSGEEISTAKVVENQTFKEIVTEEAIEIDGYVKPSESQSLEITTAVNEIIFEYAKRTDLAYTVEYLEADTNEVLAEEKVVENQTFKAEITETAIEIDGYVKPAEEAQVVEITTGENKITFYYTKRTDLGYVVKYLEADTDEVLAESKVVENQTFKDEITETAIEIDGYVKPAEETQIVEITTSGNEITFYYTKRTDLTYAVKYLEKNTDQELAESKVVENQTFKAEVTESAIEIDGFIKPDPEVQTIEIATSGNEIIFYYARKSDLSYVVKYLEADTNEVLAEEKLVENQVYETVVTEAAIEIDGYVKPSEETQEKTMLEQVNEFVFYYTKRTDLSYAVKYLDKDTNEELAEAKIVENQTFKAEVTEDAIEIDGYIKPEETSTTIEIATSGNEIIFYYSKRTDLTYTVKYLEQGTDKVLAEEKVVENQTFKAEITETAIEIPGYVKVEPAEQTIEIKTAANEIIFYYTKNTNLKYTIEYYYEGVKDDAKTVEAVGTYLDIVDTYEDKVIAGYEEVDKQNFPLTINSDENENIIKIYYEKASFEYTVHYYYDGVEDTSKVETSTAKFEEEITEYIEKPITGYVLKEVSELTITEIPENNILNVYYEKGKFAYSIHYYYQGVEDISKVENGTATYGDVISAYTDKNITGYKFDNVENLNLTITENAENNIINVYYIKDSFEYTVEYYYDGVIDNTKTATDIAAFEDKIEQYEDKVIPGYELVSTDNLPLTITEKPENNIIKIYYEKGEYNYTVHYYYEGVENVSKVEKIKATYLDVIEDYENKNITGYKLEKVENLPLTISEVEADNVINVYYVKDTFEYTVHYFYEGIEDTEKMETATATYEDVITEYTDKNIEDFRLVKEENLPLRITENSSENVINIYYEKNMFEYTVNYFYDGVENEEVEETLLGKYESQITEYPEKNIPGYKLEKTEGLPLTIDKEAENNVINVYYVKDNFEYRVEYYYDGVIDEEKTEKNIALYDSEITEYTDKNIEGYKLDKVEGTPLTIKEIVQNNVIKVYYVIDETNTKELSYTVKYYKDGVLDEEATQVVSQRVQVLQPDYMEVDKTSINIVDKYEGYKLDATQTKEIPNFANNGEVIEIYYIRKDATVVVHYYERNSETELSETITISGKVFDEYTTEAKELEGYTLVADSENTTGTMEENEVVVTYYYAKNVKATINHVDIATGNIIEAETIDTKDGDILEVLAKDIENYVLVQSPEDTTIEIGKEDIEVTFYYSHISEGVIEKHIDKITNEVIESNVYQGKEGDTYTTSAIEIEGYDLVTDLLPENAEGTMTVEVIEVKYYYIRKASVVVEYVDYITGEKLLEKDENGEDIDSTIVGNGHENDEYTTAPKEFDGYVLVETPENATGTMKIERTVDEEGNEVVNIITKVIYKYAREASVRVEYYDIETNEKIAEDDLIEGYEGKDYSVEAKEIAKYEVVETPENTEGVMRIEEITNEETGEVTENSEIVVTFKYMKKDGKVIVRYIDKATGNVLDETEITGKIDTEYETQEKEITDYTYLREEKPENATGTITEETIVVNYYYVKVAKVVVQYIDKYTGEVIYEREVYEGYEGEDYTTRPPEVDGYVLITEEYPNNAEGKYEMETQEVTYYYARKTTVEVSYIDSETGAELLEKEIIEGKEGDSYTTEAKEVDYYKLQDSENAEGVMKVTITKDEETGIEEVDTVTKVVYKYRKANFDIAVEKTVKEVLVDGTNKRVNNNKLVKVEIHRKEISEANVKVIYEVKVTNNGELPGSAIVSDMIPEGLTFDSSVNRAWTPKGDQAYVETSVLKPGESATYEIILTWNGKDEIGTFTNQIEVVSTENTPDYEEENTRNNKSEATVIIVTATGIEMIINQIDMKTVGNIGILSLYFVLIYVFVIKRKRD